MHLCTLASLLQVSRKPYILPCPETVERNPHPQTLLILRQFQYHRSVYT
jgi:hypothetical protein